MRGLTLTQREQARLQTLNLVLEGRMGVGEAAYILGLSERHTWRIIASYRKAVAAGLAHGNRGCRPINPGFPISTLSEPTSNIFVLETDDIPLPSDCQPD